MRLLTSFLAGMGLVLCIVFAMDFYFNSNDYSTTPCLKPQRALGIEPQTLDRYERGEVHREP